MAHKLLWAQLKEKLKTAHGRLFAAMACYAVLLALALYELLPIRSQYDRYLLGVVLLVFTLLILKTLIHSQQDGQD